MKQKQHNKRKKSVYKKDKCRCGRLKGINSKRCNECKRNSSRGLAWNRKIKKYDSSDESFKMKALNLNDNKKHRCEDCGAEFRLKGTLNTHKFNCVEKKC